MLVLVISNALNVRKIMMLKNSAKHCCIHPIIHFVYLSAEYCKYYNTII